MAKMFYNLEEAMAKLGCDEPTLKEAVRRGDLREFRDGNTSNYKVEEIDKLAVSGELSGGKSAAPSAEPETKPEAGSKAEGGAEAEPKKKQEEPELDLSGSLGEISLSDSDNPIPDLSATGSIGLGDTGGINLADEDFSGSGSTAGAEAGKASSGSDLLDASSIDLSATGDEDMISFDDEGPDQTAAGKEKDDTVVSSVGVSVFDEEDLDEDADPAAKTAMSATSGGTGLEGVGSGSGLLDLTRESDDTSLGAELLDEIYPGDESGTGTVEMGESTRAGLEEVAPKAPDADTDEQEAVALEEAEPEAEAEEKPKAPAAAAVAAPRGDMFAAGASGLVAVAVIVMCFAGLAIASMIRGVWPSILDFVYGKLWMFGVGAVVVAGAAMGLGVFLGRRSQS
jgi:hypothetical protein